MKMEMALTADSPINAMHCHAGSGLSCLGLLTYYVMPVWGRMP